MRFFDFMFCKIYNYEGKEYGVITPSMTMTVIFILNIIGLVFFLQTIGLFDLEKTDIDKSILFRLVVGPALAILLSLPLYFYYRRNNYYKKLIEQFQDLEKDQKKSLNRKFIAYLIVSVVFLFASMASPMLFKFILTQQG